MYTETGTGELLPAYSFLRHWSISRGQTNMAKLQISGRVVYQDLGTGFWGIIDASDRKWRPLNLPKKLQQEGLEVNITAVEATEDVSIFMWGQPIEIVEG